MNYQVISSGSDGNAVVINEDILIDCGVSFKKMKDYYSRLKIVFLTHVHSDHFKKSTIKKLAEIRPTLRFACCEWLISELIECGVQKKNIDVLSLGNKYDYESFVIEPVELFHDVPNCGYKIFIENKKMIYATDTKCLEHIEAKNYDLYLVEGNYFTEELQEKIGNKEERGEYAYETRVKETHMSRENTNDWLVSNMGTDSKFEYMHQHKEKEKI